MDVAVICGRNQRLRRRLTRLAERAGGRLTVHGFVDNMADWLRCADIVVGKAGPGTIAEATCCAAPLVLTSYLPGQEEGNAEFVIRGRRGQLRGQATRALPRRSRACGAIPAALAAMRAASARAGRPAGRRRHRRPGRRSRRSRQGHRGRHGRHGRHAGRRGRDRLE